MSIWEIIAQLTNEGYTLNVVCRNRQIVANIVVRRIDCADSIELLVSPMPNNMAMVECQRIRRINGDVDGAVVPNFFGNASFTEVGYAELPDLLHNAIERASDPQVGANIDPYDC